MDDADALPATHFRAQELARRTVEYHRQREAEHRSRERFGRRFTPFAWAAAAEAVLADEALEDEAAVVALIRELGRQGCCEVALAALELVLGRGSPPPSKPMFDAAMRVCATEYQDERCAALLARMQALGLAPDLLSANLLLAALCGRGRLGPALELLGRMRTEMGAAPNTFSVLMLLQACNYKRRGAYREAIEAVQALEVAEPDGVVSEDVVEALLQVCEAAMHKAPSFEAACAVFRCLHEGERRLAGSPGVRGRAYNALLGAAGRAGAWREAQELYAAMRAEGLPASLQTHTALIQACVVGRALDHALELFEGLVAGRSASEAVPASIATYNHLIHACHQAGMLEKALEIASWVAATGVAFDDETYGELMATIDVAQLWDDKAMKQAMHRHGAVLPSQLRPAPYDPMRIMYLDHLQALQQEEALAREKLGPEGSWAPRSLTRGAAGAASGLGGTGPTLSGPVPSLGLSGRLSPTAAAGAPAFGREVSLSPTAAAMAAAVAQAGAAAGGSGQTSPLRRSAVRVETVPFVSGPPSPQGQGLGMFGQGQGSGPAGRPLPGLPPGGAGRPLPALGNGGAAAGANGVAGVSLRFSTAAPDGGAGGAAAGPGPEPGSGGGGNAGQRSGQGSSAAPQGAPAGPSGSSLPFLAEAQASGAGTGTGSGAGGGGGSGTWRSREASGASAVSSGAGSGGGGGTSGSGATTTSSSGGGSTPTSYRQRARISSHVSVGGGSGSGSEFVPSPLPPMRRPGRPHGAGAGGQQAKPTRLAFAAAAAGGVSGASGR